MKRLLALLALLPLIATAQQINGKVVDAKNNKALPYASVLYASQKKIMYSDSTGYFRFNIDSLDKKDSIHIIYLGYKELVIPVATLIADNIFRMEENATTLAPVIVSNCRHYKEYTINRKVGKVKDYAGPGPEVKFVILGRYTGSKDAVGFIRQLEIYAGDFNISVHVPVRVHWYAWDSVNNVPGAELTNSNIIVYPYQQGWNTFQLPENGIYFSEQGIVMGLEFIYPVEYVKQLDSFNTVDEKAHWLMNMNNRWSVGIETIKDATQAGFYQINNVGMIKYNSRGRGLYIKPAIRFTVVKCMD